MTDPTSARYRGPLCRPGSALSSLLRACLALLVLLVLPASVAVGQGAPGEYVDHRVEGRQVTVRTTSAALRLVFFAPDVVRVDFLPEGTAGPDSSLIVVRDTTEAVTVRTDVTDERVMVATEGLRVRVDREPVRLSFYDADGALLVADGPQGGLATDGPHRVARFTLADGEHLYATGPRGLGLDLRGEAFPVYNTQVYGYNERLETMNLNVPLVLSSGGYGVLFENTSRATADLGESDPDVWSYEVEGGALSYYLIAAPTVPEQIARYTWLTGRAPMPPKWALGYVQSKYGYRDEQAVRDVVDALREKDIPVDAVVLDLFWFDHMGDLSWNRDLFPEPLDMVEDLREQGVKTVVITEPYVVERSPTFDTLLANPAYAARTEAGDVYRLPEWWSCGCDAALVDMTNPEARAWWWDKHPTFLGGEDGVAGLWTDLGEPERHPDDMQHHMGPAPRIHNAYNLLWAQSVYDGLSRLRPDERVFNLTRSGYAGIQRYGVFTWSGDVGRSFEAMEAQLPILLSAGLSGLGYHGFDVGGFAGESTPEEYARWIQFGALTPAMRAHGVDNQPTEPWGFGDEGEAIAKRYIELRYRLLPYLYTLAWENHRTGLPLVRPLFFADPGDSALADYDEAFMLGDALLVAPVTEEGARSRRVRLPEGEWVDFWTDSLYTGPQEVTVDAPLDRLPLFVRGGSFLPMQPVMDYVDEHPADSLTLHVYGGRPRGEFTLYEDDGSSRAYERGEWASTRFNVMSEAGEAGEGTMTITAAPTLGSYIGQPEERVYRFEVHRVGREPTSVTLGEDPLTRYDSTSELDAASHGYAYDSDLERLVVQTTVPIRTAQEITISGAHATTPAARPVDE